MTKTTLNAIRQVFHRSKVQPKTFRSDAENEFAGKKVHQFLVDKKIYQQLIK